MDSQLFWSSFVGAIGGTTVIVGIAGFLLQNLFKQWLTLEVEKFKSDLQEEVQQRLKRFAHLYDERARAIKELYALVVRADKSFLILSQKWQPVYGADDRRMTNDEEDDVIDDEKLKEEHVPFQNAVNDYANLDNFYQENKLYLEQDSRAVLQKLLDTYWGVFTAKHSELRAASVAELYRTAHIGATDIWVQEVQDQAERAHALMQNEAKAVMDELEVTFQKFLES